MQFFFQGAERLGWIYGSPNRLSIVIAAFLLLTIGLWCEGRRFFGNEKIWFCWKTDLFFGLALIALSVALVLTYSRCGWIGYGAGLCFLLWAGRNRREIWAETLAALLLFLICVVLLPEGMDRLSSSWSFDEDHSVRNRLLLWNGTLALIADHWRSGVGFQNFSQTLFLNYLDPRLEFAYGHPLNNYLKVGAGYGLPMLAAFLTILFYSLGCCYRFARRYALAWIAAAGGVLLAWMIHGCFTSSIKDEEVSIPVLLPVVCALGYGVWRAWRVGEVRSWQGKQWGISLGVSVIFCGVMWVAGHQISITKYPWITRKEKIWVNGLEVPYISVQPKRGEAFAQLIFLQPKGMKYDSSYRSLLQPLAAYGVEVFSPAWNGDLQQCAAVISVLQKRRGAQGEKPFFLAGRGDAWDAMQAFIPLTRNLRGVILLSPLEKSAKSAFSFELKNIPPFFILYGGKAPPALLQTAHQWSDRFSKAGIECRAVKLAEKRYFLEECLPTVAETVAIWMKQQANNPTLFP